MKIKTLFYIILFLLGLYFSIHVFNVYHAWIGIAMFIATLLVPYYLIININKNKQNEENK